MSRGDLLTTANPKTAKSAKYGYLTAILHLAPARMSGHNVCPRATAGCTAACLNTAGRGGIGLDAAGMNDIQRARIARTNSLYANRAGFLDQLSREIEAHVRKAERARLIPCVRLNGTSDIRFESLRARGSETILERFAGLQFYDYTKRTDRTAAENYHLTFSLAETRASWNDHLTALNQGLSVAVVLSGAGDSVHPQPFPLEWNGRRLIDGDLSDLRFLDPAAVYVGLRAKGRAKIDGTGFVKPIDWKGSNNGHVL